MTREGCGALSLPSKSYESCSWLMFKGQPCQTWPLSVELRWVVQNESWPAPKATNAQFQGRSGLLLHQNGNPCPLLVGMPTTFERTNFLWGRLNGGQHCPPGTSESRLNLARASAFSSKSPFQIAGLGGPLVVTKPFTASTHKALSFAPSRPNGLLMFCSHHLWDSCARRKTPIRPFLKLCSAEPEPIP